MSVETLFSILVGIGLSAAVGLRIFVPFLVMSVAVHAGHLSLAPGFDWIGSTPALVAFAVATIVEVGAFYVPWVDNVLDAVAQPLAVAAGIVATASVVTDISPFWKWSLAIIAGGGVAGILQGGTVAARGASTLTTAGLGNPLVSTLELGGSLVTSVLAIALPVVALLFVVLVLWGMFRIGARLRRRPRTVPPA